MESLQTELKATKSALEEFEQNSQDKNYELQAQMEELRIANTELRHHALDCERRLALTDHHANAEAVVTAAVSQERAVWQQQVDLLKSRNEQDLMVWNEQKGNINAKIAIMQQERGEILQKNELLQTSIDEIQAIRGREMAEAGCLSESTPQEIQDLKSQITRLEMEKEVVLSNDSRLRKRYVLFFFFS